MELPEFLLRKLYRKGSLHETAPGHFGFALHNRLGSATIMAPPHITINGIAYSPQRVKSEGLDPAAISPRNPYIFAKGQEVFVQLPGSLLRGGNQIQVVVQTKEFGELRIEVEDRCAEFCDVPSPP